MRKALPDDYPAMIDLHDRTFGPGCYTRTAYRIREQRDRAGLPPLSPFCLVCHVDGVLVAACRFTPVTIGGTPGVLLLGPLSVEARHAGKGYGKGLVALGLEQARDAGIRLVILVGDLSYYGRLGFAPVPPGRITLPGPVDSERLLAAETAPDGLAGLSGIVAADLTGS
jgi:predicted N-acetyltransferase YhbS